MIIHDKCFHFGFKCIQPHCFHSFQVVPNSNTPKKNTGVISKAVEYMFGW